MPPSSRRTLFAVFFATGFSALTLQTVWQRLIAVHNGVDLVSFTTVVAAFLAGLGAGGLLGGVLADRLGPRRSLIAFAAANVGVGLYAWASTALFYDLYRDVRPHLAGNAAAFAFNVALLLVPTTLMGLSLPLLARGAVERTDAAGPLLGRLYAVNTFGAALGAAVAGWFALGALGFATTARAAGTLNLLAAAALAVLARRTPADSVRAPHPDGAAARPLGTGVDATRAWPWFVAYAVTGAVALGFETVFFRVIDALMRSNSYSFPHLLSLYLALFGTGAAVGARFVARTGRPDRWFVWIQVGVAASTAAGLLVLTRVAPALGGEHALRAYFGSDNLNTGFAQVHGVTEWAKLVFAYAIGPLLVLGVPVLLMGASYPFVQALVTQRMDTLGRRTGTLFAANVAGNVAGTLIVGFVLLDRLGTIDTIRVLGAVLVALGVVGAVVLTPRERRVQALGALAVTALLLLALPPNKRFWAFFHGVPASQLKLDEERACVNTTKPVLDEEMLFVNASSQNAYPYDDFHVLIGLTPTLLHPSPARALVVGLGIGSTPWSVSRDARLRSVDTVEICGGQVDILEQLAAEGKPEVAAVLDDRRVAIHEGDGRDWLLSTDDRYDIVVVDVLRTQSAFSGNLYSTEFYELVRSHLAEGGLFAQWMPTQRAYNSATEVFPYASTFTVASYGSRFMVASNEPLAGESALQERLRSVVPAGAIAPAQLDRLAGYYAQAVPVCARAGALEATVPSDALNTDLHPRDEYFLNNPAQVPERAPC